MRSHRSRVAVRRGWVGALLLCVGCAPSRASQTSPTWKGTSPSDASIIVIVENHLWNDVVVRSAPASGAPVRLGTATTGIPKRFRIPAHHVHAQDLELTADPVGSASIRRSGSIMVTPGQEIRWTLHESESVSQLTVH